MPLYHIWSRMVWHTKHPHLCHSKHLPNEEEPQYGSSVRPQTILHSCAFQRLSSRQN